VDPFGQRVDARNRLHVTAHLPLLVVWGRRDAVIPVAHGTALAEAVEGARLEVFEQSGHFPHLTEPHRLSALLADWLATTPVSPAAE
jgi:pimeloyl-ACP methyl ester carboxylesterase